MHYIQPFVQCVIEAAEIYPAASEVALRDFYVDDLISGTDDEDEAIMLQQQMEEMMDSGGFPIRKWATNSWSVSTAIKQDHLRDKDSIRFTEFSEYDAHSVLGLVWQPSSDSFKFAVDDTKWEENATKRTIASDVAKLFDPIGLLSPVTVAGRIFIRDLWIQMG